MISVAMLGVQAAIELYMLWHALYVCVRVRVRVRVHMCIRATELKAVLMEGIH